MVVDEITSKRSDVRTKSPLCDDDYRLPLAKLPKAVPPRWMYTSMLWSIGVTVVLTAATLLSPMDEYVTAPGEVRPAEYAYVFSRAEGILETIDVKDGEKVRQGQVLARLDGWEIRKRIREIEADIAQTEAELAMAEAAQRKVTAAPVPAEFLFSAVEMERQKEIQGLQQDYLHRLNELQKTGAASGTELLNIRLQLIASESMLKRSQQAYDLFKGDYGAASQTEAAEKVRVTEARLAGLRSRLESAQSDLKRLEIIAPGDGNILTTARRFPGEKIAAGTALFKISDDNDKTELRLYATEDRVNLIQPGQLVRFRANNNPDRLAPLAIARVTEVARDRDLASEDDAADTNRRSTYRVKAAIEKEPYPLAVGATVEAEIVLERRPFWRLLLMKPQPTGAKL